MAKEAGIAAITINSWLANLKGGTLSIEQNGDDPVSERSMKEKMDLLLEYQKVAGDTEGEWLRQKGLHSEHIALFRQELTTHMNDKSADKDQ